jgi:hypothetical protein
MDYHTIARFVSGNIIGIVEEPLDLRGIPKRERRNHRLVKIGVIDPNLAEKETFPMEDAEKVVSRLYDFTSELVKKEEKWLPF